MVKPRIKTDEQRKAIKELFPHMETAQLAEMLGFTESQLIYFATKNGIKKSPEFRSAWARKNTIQSNAGYKKGYTPCNSRPIGSTRIDSQGNIVVKIAEPRVWILLHKKIWEDANGPIPDDHIIVYKDGNKMNCQLDNLLLMSRRDHMLKNTVHNLPPEIKELINLRGNLIRCINHRERKNKNGK